MASPQNSFKITLFVALAFALLVVALVAAFLFKSDAAPEADPDAEARIRPVAHFVASPAAEVGAGEVNAGETVAADATPEATESAPADDSVAPAESPAGVDTIGAASASKDGATVYAFICKTCHDIGLAGAPKKGDKAAWAPRIATGKESLYASALKGKGAMPPKGGAAAALSDEDVKAGVDYMVNLAQ
ncbi:MAG: c-type cytochrome [Zoogloeaceae bacterium]|nr:c-type cytochrome [Zoogloeaceae bacterium]